ncbi:T9SS-dependent M36 family metallopeptidase [uncultured Pontibacter sp.]|uniref:T9SS-dependent M36 family metallopeptidase n=1 Tax=uncultured Pontibacter sp. TaxID=453356 RepID=UPI0026319766|nr:T9SS-dependent M36 family metallopeptidase [uncultured Pontibacter sp.]
MTRALRMYLQLALIVVMLSGTTVSFAQGNRPAGKKQVPQVALDHINKNKAKLKVKDKDVSDLALSGESESKRSGVKHYYIKQQYDGIEIHGAITNMSVNSRGEVVTVGNRFQEDIDSKVSGKQPALDANGAVAAAARHLGVSVSESLTVLENTNAKNREVLLSNGGISLEPIPAKLVYQPMLDGTLRLAWEVSIYELDAQNWWNLRVDASTGELLDKDNMVVHCLFENDGADGKLMHDTHRHATSSPLEQELDMAPYAPTAGPVNNGNTPGLYEVYPMPIESPIHGNRKPMNAAAVTDRIASPSGWHTAGSTSYTITRGNNVYAYEDPNNTGHIASNNDNGADVVHGHSPDGGTQRVFKYPVDFSQEPEAYRDAAITNLFYWNNIIHDMWYQYGFDEASGNFQTDNFGKGGLGGDHVMAEAQDNRNGVSRNNANFATPIDGRRPRMQMYLWSGKPDPDKFQITAPASIAGSYPAGTAAFGPALSPTPITGKLVLVNSEGASAVEGCGAVLNAADVAGNIAVVYRGTCAFTIKVKNAQDAGAIAVVVINNAPGAPGAMGGADPSVTIPSVMISDVIGASIRALLDDNQEVTVSLKDDGSGPEVDGDFDNGIIVHEYGHGISNRLTGGPGTTSCLPTQVLASGQVLTTEQMGEGWSDWFGLMMTMKKGDTREKIRGIGTYAINEPTTGRGIRPAPYTTDFSVNSYTYGATNNPSLSAPHGIGFVFATILWEITWDMIDQYGFDEDLYNGKGGNNMAMQLVIDGLKLQPCYPGFVDGRDAILLADQLNYGGANQELIWRAFARRGVGYSASQGLSYYRFDQVEAFDLPENYSLTATASQALESSDLNEREILMSYPNPFSESTTISFKARESGHTVLKVYDITGREVETLFEGDVQQGETYKQTFNAVGRETGMYIYRIVNGSSTRSGTMLLIK